MYINKPLIHGSKFKNQLKSNGSNLFNESKNKKQPEKSDDLGEQLNQLLKSVQIFQNNFLVDELNLKKIGHPLQLDEAYEECIKLLTQQEQAELNSHSKIIKKIRMQDLQVQNFTKEYFRLKQNLKEKIQTISHQVSELDDNINMHNKKNKKRMSIIQQIQQEQLEVDIAKDKLHQLKQKSYQQKNQYIETQASQFRLQQLIEQHELEFKKIIQNEQLIIYYKKLQIIKKKLLNQKQKQYLPMQQYVQSLINKISRKRAQIDQYQQNILKLQQKVQEQNFIIDALKTKCKAMEKDQYTEEAWLKYKHKYNQIYFGNQNEGWSQYKKYLDELLKKNNDHQFLNKSYQIGQYQRDGHKYQRSIITQPPAYRKYQNNSIQSKEDYRYLNSQSTPLQANSKQKRISSFLPKLVKMQGNREDQDKIKQELKKFTNKQMQLSQKVSLVSFNSEEDSSGEVIQVQFHTKKETSNKKK